MAEQGGILSKISSLFFRKPEPRTPVPGFCYRIKNLCRCHWRGLWGTIIAVTIIAQYFSSGKKNDKKKRMSMIWEIIIFWFLLRPVHHVVTGLSPIWLLPFFEIIRSADICKTYFNDSITLSLLGGMIIQVLNNSGADRRIAIAILNGGNVEKFSGRRLVLKCSTAAFFLSIVSNRLIATSMIMEYFTNAMMKVESTYGYYEKKPDLKEVRFIINNAIQTSSAIGSIAFMHTASSVLCFRAILTEYTKRTEEIQDIFNYLQYCIFAFPVALITFILNLVYHMIIVERKDKISNNVRTAFQKHFKADKDQLPAKMSTHEILSIFFSILIIPSFLARYNYLLQGGWGQIQQDDRGGTGSDVVFISKIRDSTVAAFFAVLLHSLPSSFTFLKYVTAKVRRQLPPPKPVSGILWWKFVDKNLNYGYFFVMGGGCAIMAGIRTVDLIDDFNIEMKKYLTNWNVTALIIVIVGTLFANLMPGTAATSVLTPAVLCLGNRQAAKVPQPAFLGALGVGIATTYGFLYPFLYTPAYFCYYIGKVPVSKMIRYSAVTLILSIIILWLALAFYAPIIWKYTEISVIAKVTTTTPPPPERRSAE